jgi:glutathione peroxidase
MPALLTGLAQSLATVVLAAAGSGGSCPPLLNHTLPKLHSSESVALCEFAGRPLLVVNTASYCGYTGQFRGLEALWKARKDSGLIVIGFPSDDFNQEDSDAAKTAEVCYINYGVSFPMVAASPVARGNVNPVFAELQKQGARLPGWNFHKYVIDRQGRLVAQFGSGTEPNDPALAAALKKAAAR